MNKQFWITFKQFMLYLLLSQGIMVAGAIATVIKGGMNGIKGDALMDYIFSSKITIGAIVLGYVATIAVFQGRRYAKIKTGRIEHDRLWKTIGAAALIAFGWMFIETGILQLIDADKLFADEIEELEKFGKIMSGPLGAIAVGILAPISEEIGFRGVLMGGLLRMRCGAWPAIVISALVFALFHGTQIQLLGTTVFGIISGWLYWRTRSLIPSMIIHMVNNSTACILEMVAPDYEPGKIASVAFIVAFLPILIYGLGWFKRYGYQSCIIFSKKIWLNG